MRTDSLLAKCLFLIGFAWVWLPIPGVSAQGEPFYKGKTIRVMVGTTAGGFYDRWARLFSRYMPKYIPGHPEMIVQNMPAAGGVVAANYVYAVAKPDGLTMAMPQNNIYLDQLVGRGEVKFDMRKFNWIGTQEKNHMLLYMRADAPYKTIDDVRHANEPPRCGGTGTASSDYILARMLEETIGAKIQSVLGYPGGSEIDLAVERGEVLCRGMTLNPHFGREPFIGWHKKGFDRHLVQGGRKRDARAADTPTVFDLMDRYKTPEASRRLAVVMLAGAEFGRPMLATPGVPPDRVKLLREAYVKAMNDPELLAEAKKEKMDVELTTGEELQALAQEVMDQTPDVIEKVKRILGQ